MIKAFSKPRSESFALYYRGKIWIMIIIGVVVAGGFFAWQYFWAPGEKIKDETANWQTYRNEEYGFEMRFPDDFTASRLSSGAVTFQNPNAPNDGRMIIEFKNQAFEEVIANIPVEDVKNITIGNRDSIYYSLGEHNQSNQYYEVKVNENQILEIQIILTEYGSLSFEEQSEIFNQMLSTFRFSPH